MVILRERPIQESEQKTRLIMWNRSRTATITNKDGTPIKPVIEPPKSKRDIRWFPMNR